MVKLITVVALVLVAMLLLPAAALAQPEVSWFYGDVVVDGEKAPDGTVVSAWIEGNKTAETTTTDGEYVLAVGEPGKTYPGATVTFMVDGSDTGVTRTWVAGEPFETDLTVGEAPIGPGAEIEVDVRWTAGNSTLEDSVLTLYLGEKPADGAAGAAGAAGTAGTAGEPGEDAPGGIALPLVALIIAIIAVGVAVMSMRRKV